MKRPTVCLRQRKRGRIAREGVGERARERVGNAADKWANVHFKKRKNGPTLATGSGRPSSRERPWRRRLGSSSSSRRRPPDLELLLLVTQTPTPSSTSLSRRTSISSSSCRRAPPTTSSAHPRLSIRRFPSQAPANRPDTRNIFVDIGLSFYVEFTWQEALQFISVREARLARHINEYTHLIASIKAQIKLVCEGIRELLQLPAK